MQEEVEFGFGLFLSEKSIQDVFVLQPFASFPQ